MGVSRVHARSVDARGPAEALVLPARDPGRSSRSRRRDLPCRAPGAIRTRDTRFRSPGQVEAWGVAGGARGVQGELIDGNCVVGGHQGVTYRRVQRGFEGKDAKRSRQPTSLALRHADQLDLSRSGTLALGRAPPSNSAHVSISGQQTSGGDDDDIRCPRHR